jgi:hypothetical protein
MRTTIDLDTERTPIGRVLGAGTGAAVKPFGITFARWQPNFRHDRDAVTLDPDSQIGYVGDQPVKEIVSGDTTSQYESDGQTSISLDYGVDDRK